MGKIAKKTGLDSLSMRQRLDLATQKIVDRGPGVKELIVANKTGMLELRQGLRAALYVFDVGGEAIVVPHLLGRVKPTPAELAAAYSHFETFVLGAISQLPADTKVRGLAYGYAGGLVDALIAERGEEYGIEGLTFNSRGFIPSEEQKEKIKDSLIRHVAADDVDCSFGKVTKHTPGKDALVERFSSVLRNFEGTNHFDRIDFQLLSEALLPLLDKKLDASAGVLPRLGLFAYKGVSTSQAEDSPKPTSPNLNFGG